MKKTLVLAGLLIGAFQSQAQQIPFYTQYYLNPFIYNPAFAGADEDVNAFLMHRAQWRDIEGAPVTSALSVNGPVKTEKIGLGFTLYNDVSNILERTGLSASYSYRLVVSDEHNLLFGLQLGLLDNRVNFSQVAVNDANDPMLYAPGVRKTSLDAGFGVGYRWRDLEAGISIPQIASNRVEFPGTQDSRAFYTLSRHYMGSVKYNFMVNESKGMSAYPMVLVRYIPGAPFQMDLNGVFNWENRGWAALSYKMGYAVAINLGVQIKEGLSVGYAYDYITGDIRNYSGASHEIALSYRFTPGRDQSPALPPADDNNYDELKRKTEENENEIRQLREALDQLLTRDTTEVQPVQDSVQIEVTPEIIPSDSATGQFESGAVNGGKDFVTEKSADFIDKNGNPVEKGMYVILGAFKSLENAERAMVEFTSRGYTDANYIHNTRIGFYEVYVTHPGDTEAAVNQLMESRKEYPDAWILILE